jgi:hypothetical protein
MPGQNIDLDGKPESHMEEWRATHYVGRKARKSQDASRHNLLQRSMFKPFAVPSASNWNIGTALYAELERDYGRSQLTEFSNGLP